MKEVMCPILQMNRLDPERSSELAGFSVRLGWGNLASVTETANHNECPGPEMYF